MEKRVIQNEEYNTLVEEQTGKRAFALGACTLHGKYRTKWTGKTKGVETEREKLILTDQYLGYLKGKGLTVGNKVLAKNKDGNAIVGTVSKINKTTFTLKVDNMNIPVKFANLIKGIE